MPTPDDYNNQPGYRNFIPPPTTPDYWTRSNDRGSAAQHPVGPSNYNSPQATQTAAAPPPPPPGPPTPLTPPVPPPAPPNENINQPTPPTPDQAKPEPAAKPLPNLGAWTPDQAKPWLHARVIPPQQVPDRPPDTHVGTRPAWNPRPGEAGYGKGPRQPGNYSLGEMLGFALQAGFTGPAAYTAAAIGLAESNGNPNAIHYQDGGKPYNSYGLMQINGSNDAAVGGARNALDPLTSFKQAYTLSKGGTDFSAWSTFKDGSYKAYLDGNARPEASSTLVVGPRQEYRPSQEREPQHWGREPEHDWTPGRMPTSHDIPNILGALLPIAIAGVLGGGGLGMIAAYTGYQNARNKGQLEEAKEARTRWRDQLAETEAGLKEELLESSGLMAEFGNDFTSPAAQQAWGELAAKYQDPQLRAALESGNPAAVEQLFKKRDEAFQSINKVSAADTKAAQQEQEKQSNEAAERSTVTPDGGGGGVGGAPGGAPGATPAAARGPERPWENLGPGFAGGGPAAGGQPTPPAAAPRPAGQPAPAPEQPPADQPAPPAEGQPPEAPAPGVDGQPQPAAAPGQPPPEHFDVGVGGLAPANLPARLAPQVTGLTPDRLDQDARQYLETQKDPYKGGPSGDPLAIVRNEAVRVRASQMQSYIDQVIRDTKPGHIEDALQKIDTVDPGLAAVARLVDRGDQAPPSGWQTRVPFYQTINKLVTSLDPTWSAARWVTNYRTQVAFSSGTQSTQIASMNRALQHMTILYEAAKRLPQAQGGVGEWTDLNGLRNFVNTHLGSDAATNFMEARAAVARELERAFRGGSGAYAEIKADLDNVSSSGSPEQILGYIRTSTELLKGQLDAMADLYQRGTHKQTTGNDLLSPEARATYERIMRMPIDKVPEGQPPPAELDNTATPPPSGMTGPGPAPVEMPPGWTEQPQQ